MLRITHYFAAVILATSAVCQQPEPIKVCTSTPNLGALVRAVAGEAPLELTVLAKPRQDPHYVVARPSYVKRIAEAELVVVVGLELEVGWMPVLLEQARNNKVRPGRPGYLDASTAIQVMQRTAGNQTTGQTDRSQGHLHVFGNPHYLTDPVRGYQVAEAIAERLGELRPKLREAFNANLADLRLRLGTVMVGEKLAQRYDFTKLARLAEHGKLSPFLKSTEELDDFGGLLARAEAHRGAKVLVDHDAWPYVARRLGLEIAGFLEPLPGIPPTTRHLSELVDRVREQHIAALLFVPYFERGSVEFMVEHTGLIPVELAHQVGAAPGTDDYAALVRYDLEAILDALDRAASDQNR